MKVLLFAPCYLDEGERLQRNLKWLNYIKPLKEKLGYTDILLVDNASSKENLEKLTNAHPDVAIIRKTVSLNRISEHAYGYWYRAFAEAAKYAMENGYDKIIHIDTDVYPFTDRICEYIKNTNTGWNCFWCEMHKYPESTFQIIGKDKFQEMYEFMTEGFLQFYPYGIAENRIPWTHVEKGFIGDRYPEKHIFTQDPSWDYCGQVPPGMQVKFNG